eukprot:2612896-Prymnesium_polylepis.1
MGCAHGGAASGGRTCGGIVESRRQVDQGPPGMPQPLSTPGEHDLWQQEARKVGQVRCQVAGDGFYGHKD